MASPKIEDKTKNDEITRRKRILNWCRSIRGNETEPEKPPVPEPAEVKKVTLGKWGKAKTSPQTEDKTKHEEITKRKRILNWCRSIRGTKTEPEKTQEPEVKKVTVGKWGKAITGVREIQKNKSPALDPFLERFTVTGRSHSEENKAVVYEFKDYFTKNFWKTFIVDPSGGTYFYWSMVVMFAVLYNLMFLIMRLVFPQVHRSTLQPLWFTFDYFSDSIYIFDMFIKSRVAFLEQGLLVRDIKRLTKAYLKTWMFVVDILSVLPTDFFYILWPFNAALRFNRILKLWRLREFFHMAETHTNFPNLIRVSNLVLYIIIIIHWNGCFFFGISYFIGFGSDEWVYPELSEPGYEDFAKQYTYCLYWSTLTLTTIGAAEQPVTPSETIYCFICSLMGVLIFATIFGNVGAMINNMDAARNEFQTRVDNVKRYMFLRGIGDELQHRVIKWFDYTWNNKQSVDDKEALQYLPEKLRAELSIHVHMNTLRRVSIFQDCEPGLLVELVLKLKLQVYSPSDFICRKGDIGKEMYIIKRGKLQVVSEDGKKVFVTLSDGAVFGEISVLNIAGNKTGNRRTASVKTVGFSDLFCLTKNDLWEALEEYPEAKKMLLEKGKQLLRKDKLLDEEAAVREERRQQAMVSKIEMIVDTVDGIRKSLDKVYEKLDKLTEQTSSSSRSTHGGFDIARPGDVPEKVASAPRLSRPSPIKEEEESEAKESGKKTETTNIKTESKLGEPKAKESEKTTETTNTKTEGKQGELNAKESEKKKESTDTKTEGKQGESNAKESEKKTESTDTKTAGKQGEPNAKESEKKT